MTQIRDILAENLKKHRQARGWSQAILAEKAKTSTHYIGMLETMNKFPSSEMIQKLAIALDIDPTELFSKDIDPVESMKRCQTAAYVDVGEAVNQFISDFITKKIKKMDNEATSH